MKVMKKIKRNRMKCLICGDVIESKFTHDFVWCQCGNLGLDGGLEYVRYVTNHPETVRHMTEFEPDDD